MVIMMSILEQHSGCVSQVGTAVRSVGCLERCLVVCGVTVQRGRMEVNMVWKRRSVRVLVPKVIIVPFELRNPLTALPVGTGQWKMHQILEM